MKENGLIDNVLQDLLQYERQLNRPGLLIVANQLKAKNDEEPEQPVEPAE